MNIAEANKICAEYKGGSLSLSSLRTAEGLKLPSSIGGGLHLGSLKTAVPKIRRLCT